MLLVYIGEKRGIGIAKGANIWSLRDKTFISSFFLLYNGNVMTSVRWLAGDLTHTLCMGCLYLTPRPPSPPPGMHINNNTYTEKS